MSEKTLTVVRELKEEDQDFEFYPTTDEMLEVIAPYMESETVLDIGCGLCHFKKYMDKVAETLAEIKTANSKNEAERDGRSSWCTFKANDTFCCKIDKYFVIEKSLPLLMRLDEDAICMGTDFNKTNLIDKKVTTIFCNPPYSDFTEWMLRIISQGYFTKQAFLVVPVRWQQDIQIQTALETYHTEVEILGEFDFLNGERQARAKIHVLRLKRSQVKYRNSDVNEDAFDVFFKETFSKNVKKEYEYNLKEDFNERVKTTCKNELTLSEDYKSAIIENLYNEEVERLHKNLNAIMQLDSDVMETFNISLANIKTALIEKLKGLKVIYWNLVWDELDLITSRLTSDTRKLLKEQYQELYNMDVTKENIWVLAMYVVKHANSYYDTQLINFYKKLSDEKNVKPYKSNQKLFKQGDYRWNKYDENNKKYFLDYRMIMSSIFRESWGGKFDIPWDARDTVKDIIVIARNLGFSVTEAFEFPNDFNETAYLYLEDGSVFMEYKAYKNRNMHVKFHQEFTKALNIEAARLLGWISSPKDIITEFPEEYHAVAEKYFNANYTAIGRKVGLIPVLQ